MKRSFHPFAYLCLLALQVLMPLVVDAQEKPAAPPTAVGKFSVVQDIAYKQGPSDYESERCRLDVYRPGGSSNGPALVWFYGGGLTAGSKEGDEAKIVGQTLAEHGVTVVMPDYRLSPQATYPAYVDDAAAAVAWAFAHIGEHGGDSKKIFVGGHSAGRLAWTNPLLKRVCRPSGRICHAGA